MLRLTTAAILMAGAAVAQQHSPRCAPKEYIFDLLMESGKTLAAEGLTGTQVFQLYLGEGGTWMTIAILADGFACVNAGGVGWTEIAQSAKDDPL